LGPQTKQPLLYGVAVLFYDGFEPKEGSGGKFRFLPCRKLFKTVGFEGAIATFDYPLGAQ